jgi:hypothetical protein
VQATSRWRLNRLLVAYLEADVNSKVTALQALARRQGLELVPQHYSRRVLVRRQAAQHAARVVAAEAQAQQGRGCTECHGSCKTSGSSGTQFEVLDVLLYGWCNLSSDVVTCLRPLSLPLKCEVCTCCRLLDPKGSYHDSCP